MPPPWRQGSHEGPGIADVQACGLAVLFSLYICLCLFSADRYSVTWLRCFQAPFQCTCHSRHIHKRPDRQSQAPVTASDALPFQEASAPGRGGLSDESDEAFALVHFCLSVLGVISCHSLADPSLFLVSGCSGALFAFLGLPISPSLFRGFIQCKSLYPCTVYGRAGLAADSLCCGVQSKSLLPPSP